MGLLLGLGLLGAAFGIDAAKQAPFDRALRRLDNEWGTCTSEESRRCDALRYAVQNGLCAEPQNSTDQDNVVINLLFSLGMLGLALVVWAMIYIVLS